jgi:antitoxin ParD1/3/4
MNISLTPELERFVQNKVESGMYTSASEVIRESLRLLHTHDDLQAQRIKQLNQAIDVGLQQLNGSDKIPAKESYNRLKNKIDKIAKDKKGL